MKLSLFSTLASAAFFALACTGGGTTTTSTEAPPAPPVPAAVTPAAATGEIGVAECDQYIKDMTACLGTMDAATKAAMETSFKATADAWRAAAATPEGKAGLAMGCKAALSAIPANCTTPGGSAAPGVPGTTVTTTTTITTEGTAPAAEAPKADAKAGEHGHSHDDGANPHKQGNSIQPRGGGEK